MAEAGRGLPLAAGDGSAAAGDRNVRGDRGDRGVRGVRRIRGEAVVAWLVLGTALAWGISVAGTWLEARPWFAAWTSRDVVATPPPQRGAWRSGEQLFLVDRSDAARHFFTQSVVALTAVGEADGRLPGREIEPAPGWFDRARRQNEQASEVPARSASIITIRGGWPWRTVVNRSLQFEPGITIEPMDTPPLAFADGPQRLPVFPLPWSLLGMGAALGGVLAWSAGSLGAWWGRRRLRRRRAGQGTRCSWCGATEGHARGSARRERLGARLRTVTIFAALAVGATWVGSALVAPHVLPDWTPSTAAAWDEVVDLGQGSRRRQRTVEVDTAVARIRHVTLHRDGAALAADPLRVRPAPAWKRRAVAASDARDRREVASPGVDGTARRPAVDPAGRSPVALAEIEVGWPMPAVRRRMLVGPDAGALGPEGASVRGEPVAADGWMPPPNGHVLDPAWPGLLVNAGLLLLVVAAAVWSVVVRVQFARDRREPTSGRRAAGPASCPACGARVPAAPSPLA